MVGVGQMLTASVLAMSIEMLVGVTMKPKDSIFCMWNKHFSVWSAKLYSRRRSKTHQTVDLSSSREFEKMRISSR